MEKIKEADVLELEEMTTSKYQIVLYNDDVHTFDYVIELLMKVCKHDALQAEQCSMLVHYKGKCSVKRGEYKDLKVMAEMLLDKGLTVEIE